MTRSIKKLYKLRKCLMDTPNYKLIDKKTRIDIAKHANQIVADFANINDYLCNLPIEKLQNLAREYVNRNAENLSTNFKLDKFWETIESQAYVLGKNWTHFRQNCDDFTKN